MRHSPETPSHRRATAAASPRNRRRTNLSHLRAALSGHTLPFFQPRPTHFLGTHHPLAHAPQPGNTIPSPRNRCRTNLGHLRPAPSGHTLPFFQPRPAHFLGTRYPLAHSPPPGTHIPSPRNRRRTNLGPLAPRPKWAHATHFPASACTLSRYTLPSCSFATARNTHPIAARTQPHRRATAAAPTLPRASPPKVGTRYPLSSLGLHTFQVHTTLLLMRHSPQTASRHQQTSYNRR